MPLFGMERVRRDNDLRAEKAACLVVSSVTRLRLFSLILSLRFAFVGP